MTATETIEERGMAIYEERLREKLEAEHLGKGVAIHLDSGDYAVDRLRAKAVVELYKKHPTGEIFSLTIGPPTTGETLLATMLRGDKP